MKSNKIKHIKHQKTSASSHHQHEQEEAATSANFITLKRLEEKYSFSDFESDNVVKSAYKHVRKYYKPSGKCLLHFVLDRFPIVHCIKNYNVKENLLRDFSAGITIGIIQIPQGLYSH
jgi:hypothetical protein